LTQITRRPLSQSQQHSRAAQRQEAHEEPEPHFRETEAFIRAHEESAPPSNSAMGSWPERCRGPPHAHQGDSDDTLGLLKGVAEIAAFLEEPNLRRVYFWLSRGYVSAFKLGGGKTGIWVSTRDRIRRQFDTTSWSPPSKEDESEDDSAEPEPEAPAPRRPIRSRSAETEAPRPRRGRATRGAA
jgi:hypothetical protein